MVRWFATFCLAALLLSLEPDGPAPLAAQDEPPAVRTLPIAAGAQFGYRERTAAGNAATQLAATRITLPERMAVHIRATTSATSLQGGRTTFTMGFSAGGLPLDMKRLDWAESGRFITIPESRNWVFCGTSYVTELPKGTHTIYWAAGDVVGGSVLFDAGSLSVQAFPVSDTDPGIQPPPDAPRKLALLVGINEYRSPSVRDLQGCVNDVADMKDLLVSRFGFDETGIRVVTDVAATHAGIIQAFREHLINQATTRSLVVFYYSGHGSQAKDQATGGDEVDGWDETLVAHDSRTPDKYDITDDEINGLLRQLSDKTSNVTFIFDSCHSGTATKGAVTRAVQRDTRDQPPAPAFAQNARGILGNRSRDYVFISGCRADEQSREFRISGARRGALTYFLTREIRAAGGAVLSYRQLMDRVAPKVTARFASQHPQIEGANEKDPVFNLVEKSLRGALVATPYEDGVFLNAGATSGMTEGSVFDIFRPGPRAFGRPIAQVELTAVAPFSAQGRILSGGPVPPESLALEVKHAFAREKFPLYIDLAGDAFPGAVPATAGLRMMGEKLKSAAGLSDRFALTDSAADARLVISQTADGKIEITDGAAVLQVLDSPVTPDPATINGLTNRITSWARWIDLATLENTDTRLSIGLQVDARLPPSEGSTEPTFAVGDRVRITVGNTSDTDLHVSLIDLEHSGAITVIENWTIGAGEQESTEFEAFLADEWDELKSTIKLIATVQQSDFTFAEQGAIPRSENFATRLLDGSSVTRSADHKDEPVDLDQWITKSVTIRVVK